MKFIELTEHNITDGSTARTLLLNADRIEVVVARSKGDTYTVIGLTGPGEPTYFVKETYDEVREALRTAT